MDFSPLRHFLTKNYHLNSFILFSLLSHVVAAWLSLGYHHADEHFQILEPLGWKLCLYSSKDFAWEFGEQIRPGLQVLMAWCVGKGLLAANIYNPFLLTAILRQLTGLFCWALTWLFYKNWRNSFTTTVQQKALLIFCSLLWFIPYLHVRFSSENWGGILFFSGLYIILYGFKKSNKKVLKYLIGGLLMGLGFYIRFQMAFAIIGFIAWAFYSKQFTLKTFIALAIGGTFAAAIGAYADFWLYSDWVLTPFNYFYQNIVANVAASYGTSPFYAYITMFIEIAVPPISIVLLLWLIFGMWKAKHQSYTWILIAFIVGHSFVAHKEFRFLFPMALLVPYILTKGVELGKERLSKYGATTLKKWGVAFVIINLLLMSYSIVKPGSGREPLLYSLYKFHKKNPDKEIAFIKKEPFDSGLKLNFYRYCDTCFCMWNFTTPIDTKKELFLVTYDIESISHFKNSNIQLKFAKIPVVTDRFNLNEILQGTNKEFFWKITPNE